MLPARTVRHSIKTSFYILSAIDELTSLILVRDEWDNKKEELEKKLSDVLGVAWTVEVDPKALFPYAEEGSYGNHSPGNLIAEYIEGAHSQLSYIIGRTGGEIYKNDLNDLAHAHVITFDYTDDSTIYYNGAVVNEQGQLVIVFRENALGTNISSALEEGKLKKALQNAPSTKPLNFHARLSLAEDYEPKIAELQAKFSKLLNTEITLNNNAEANFAKLNGAEGIDSDWDQGFGRTLYSYFEGLYSQLEYNKFGADDMLQEGLLEEVSAKKIEIRVLDEIKASYHEVAIEDGILYIQVRVFFLSPFVTRSIPASGN